MQQHNAKAIAAADAAVLNERRGDRTTLSREEVGAILKAAGRLQRMKAGRFQRAVEASGGAVALGGWRATWQHKPAAAAIAEVLAEPMVPQRRRRAPPSRDLSLHDRVWQAIEEAEAAHKADPQKVPKPTIGDQARAFGMTVDEWMRVRDSSPERGR